MGVAYAVNHFQRRKKRCIASTGIELTSFNCSHIDPRTPRGVGNNPSWRLIVFFYEVKHFLRDVVITTVGYYPDLLIELG